MLRSYILSHLSDPPSTALLQLLESPRASLVNLSYLDDASGSSLLHEAARRKDLRLIELAVRAGADVFVRNRRGKMAHEGTGKDDKVRVFLRQCELSSLFIFFVKTNSNGSHQSRIMTERSSKHLLLCQNPPPSKGTSTNTQTSPRVTIRDGLSSLTVFYHVRNHVPTYPLLPISPFIN